MNPDLDLAVQLAICGGLSEFYSHSLLLTLDIVLKCDELCTSWCDLDILQNISITTSQEVEEAVKRSSGLNSNECSFISTDRTFIPKFLIWRIKREITDRTVMLHNTRLSQYPGNVLKVLNSSGKCTQHRAEMYHKNLYLLTNLNACDAYLIICKICKITY